MGERNKVRSYRQGAKYFRFKRSRVVLDELIILTRKVRVAQNYKKLENQKSTPQM